MKGCERAVEREVAMALTGLRSIRNGSVRSLRNEEKERRERLTIWTLSHGLSVLEVRGISSRFPCM